MKKLFYWGLIGFSIFEFLKVYFIMPMPGSQTIDSIDIAYFLHTYRWLMRLIFLATISAGCLSVFNKGIKAIPIVSLIVTIGIIYLVNFIMSADTMFLQPTTLELKSKAENTISGNRLIIGVEHNGETKAYPIEFLTYHHQIVDSVGGKPIIVTYCSVCRTGRVYEPKVHEHLEKFRLVGMDHYNAMFEDYTTKSWWRQSTGEAIAGTLKGSMLPEVESRQMTLNNWFEEYPHSLVMQPDTSSILEYDSLARFEQGKSRGSLIRTDSLSWKDKSWVVGISIEKKYKAYDWNDLQKERIINDTFSNTEIVLIISSDKKDFAVFERPSGETFTLNHDTLVSGTGTYDFLGRNLNSQSAKLKNIQAYQEFWHSWRTFHPETQQYLTNK